MLLRADSLAATHAIAGALASLARPGDFIVLAGDMGTGKTAFAQGFGRALGITEVITSPTFTLVHSYPCPDRKLTLHHADLYRLDRTGDVEELALHELAEFGGIVLVEWGDVAAAALGDHLEVRLSHDDDFDLDMADLERPDGGEPSAGAPGGRRDAEPKGEPDELPDDDLGLDSTRMIELHATGVSWAGRWARIKSDLAGYRW
jgi:tRNA threonylcarbamoyladenosine biosynthesis protein TsaE